MEYNAKRLLVKRFIKTKVLCYNKLLYFYCGGQMHVLHPEGGLSPSSSENHS